MEGGVDEVRRIAVRGEGLCGLHRVSQIDRDEVAADVEVRCSP